MDQRDLGTAISAALPSLATIALERVVGPPMDEFLAWPLAPVVLLVVGIVLAFGWQRATRRWLGASAMEYQSAFDKMIDRIYILPPATRPPDGITTEGVVLDHAPPAFRRNEYVKYGLPEPMPHASQRR